MALTTAGAMYWSSVIRSCFAHADLRPTHATLLRSCPLFLDPWTGVFAEDLRHTEDGVEYTLAVNVLAQYAVTGRLLGLIAKAPGGGRVVNVASSVASDSVDLDNLQVRIELRIVSGCSLAPALRVDLALWFPVFQLDFSSIRTGQLGLPSAAPGLFL